VKLDSVPELNGFPVHCAMFCLMRGLPLFCNQLGKKPILLLSFATSGGGPSCPEEAGSIYEFTAKDIDGNEVALDKYRGNVVLVVNVASA